jgi:AcrR family transcriptional regulator
MPAFAFVNTRWHIARMVKQPPEKSSKSDRTRSEILAAAQQLFAARGYDGTTIRDVAAKAAIDPAMVIRYFHNKDELFARAATINLKLPDLRGIEPPAIGEALIRHFLELWEGPDAASGKAMTILLRSAASNDFAAQKVREVFAAQVGKTIVAIGPRDTAGRRAGLVASQLLGLALCRYILKLPPVVALSRDDIVRDVGATLQRYVASTEKTAD